MMSLSQGVHDKLNSTGDISEETHRNSPETEEYRTGDPLSIDMVEIPEDTHLERGKRMGNGYHDKL